MPRLVTSTPRLRSAFRYLAAWVPVAAYLLEFKRRLLAHGEYRVAARYLGRAGPGFNLPERLGFFAADLLLAGVLVPALLLALLWLLPRRARAAGVLAVSLPVVLLTCANDLSRGSVGRFLSSGMLFDSIEWGMANPPQVAAYLGVGTVLKMLLVALASVGGAVWAHRRDEPQPTPAGPGRAWALPVVAMALALLPLTLGIGPTPFHRPALARMAAALSPAAGEARAWPSGADPQALFRELTGTPAPDDAATLGREAGHDVILLVLETVSHRSVAMEQALADMPHLERLRARALLPVAHYTTYPYSSDAVFSILTGWYPLGRQALVQAAEDSRLPGLAGALERAGYALLPYTSTRSSSAQDQQMFRRLMGTASRAPGAGPGASVLEDDRALLAALLGDIEASIAADRRYLAAFFPQYGHGPWPAAPGQAPPAAARVSVALQDGFLGEILALLERTGRLDRTLIVVTGDHGVRTRAEDPALPVGKVDDYTYHVPLLLYAPATFRQPTVVSHLTSHLDLTPTLLHLLGVPQPAGGSHGALLWDPRLAGRRLFFFGEEYLGADGYRDTGGFHMASAVTGLSYRSGNLGFPDDSALAVGGPEDREVRARLAEIRALLAWWHARTDRPR